MSDLMLFCFHDRDWWQRSPCLLRTSFFPNNQKGYSSEKISLPQSSILVPLQNIVLERSGLFVVFLDARPSSKGLQLTVRADALIHACGQSRAKYALVVAQSHFSSMQWLTEEEQGCQGPPSFERVQSVILTQSWQTDLQPCLHQHQQLC